MARPTLAPGQTYEDFPFDQLSLYAGIDVLMTGQLREKLLPALKRPIRYQVSDEETLTLPSLYEQDLCQVKSRALEFLTDLEYAGIGFDLDRYEALKGMVAERLDDYKHQLGHLNFSLSSGPQLQDYVYNVRKFPVTTLTQNNQPSTDYDTLEAYEDDELLLIARHNELQSLYNTFLNSYHLNVKRDGRIHPNYNLHGTSSHRITGNNPNLTQLPRDRGDISVRSCFTAPPGYTFVAADQSSAEVKILGAVCRDKTLLEHIRAGRDFHSATASLMLGMSYEEFLDGMENGDPDTRKKRKEFRQAAKSITFAILYGSSENTVAKKLGKDLSEVSALFRLYFENYPGIKKYIEDSHYAAKHNRFVITKLGQMRRELGLLSIFEDNGRGVPEAVYNYSLRNSQNVIIQSTSSTLGLLVFSELSRRMKSLGGRAVCTVYDSLELEIPTTKLEEGLKLVRSVMEDWPQEFLDWLDFPIRIDVEAGPSWGECRSVDRSRLLD